MAGYKNFFLYGLILTTIIFSDHGRAEPRQCYRCRDCDELAEGAILEDCPVRPTTPTLTLYRLRQGSIENVDEDVTTTNNTSEESEASTTADTTTEESVTPPMAVTTSEESGIATTPSTPTEDTLTSTTTNNTSEESETSTTADTTTEESVTTPTPVTTSEESEISITPNTTTEESVTPPTADTTTEEPVTPSTAVTDDEIDEVNWNARCIVSGYEDPTTNETYTVRDCTYIRYDAAFDPESLCRELFGNDVSFTGVLQRCYICNDDGCNSAGKTGGVILLVAMSLAIKLL